MTVESPVRKNFGVAAPSIPIIDAHIHLFDTRREGGIPWPEENQSILFRPALPDRYISITKALGVVGAIEVECSPWVEDNQWVLELAARNTVIVGKVGNLEPGKPQFREHLERFLVNPLFRGIRYGNLWGRNLSQQLDKPRFISDLRLVAQADLELDTANPNLELLVAVIRLTDQIPNLRVVIDHLPQYSPPQDPHSRAEFETALTELASRPQVFIKVTEVLRCLDGRVRTDLDFYRPKLDELYDFFGEDRLIYGSDWPNSDLWGPYSCALTVLREYFFSKGTAVAHKIFWKNSIHAYRWVTREENQPSLQRC